METSPRRKVLVIEDEPAIRNILFVLLARLGCEADIASTGAQALALVQGEKFDAVLLDLRCSNLEASEVVEGVQRLRPSLIGRVLVITSEVADAKTMELIERNFLLHVPRTRLEDVIEILSAMLMIAPTPRTHLP